MHTYIHTYICRWRGTHRQYPNMKTFRLQTMTPEVGVGGWVWGEWGEWEGEVEGGGGRLANPSTFHLRWRGGVWQMGQGGVGGGHGWGWGVAPRPSRTLQFRLHLTLLFILHMLHPPHQHMGVGEGGALTLLFIPHMPHPPHQHMGRMRHTYPVPPPMFIQKISQNPPPHVMILPLGGVKYFPPLPGGRKYYRASGCCMMRCLRGGWGGGGGAGAA
jgi:hypothetical protein